MSSTLQRRPAERAEPPSRADRALLRAGGAALAVAGIVFGVPALLMRLAAALPVDPRVLGPGLLGRADDGSLLLLVLLAVAWGAWAVMALSVVLEVWAAVRRVPTPHLPGLRGPQRVAAALIASLVVLTVPGGASSGTAVAMPSLAAALGHMPGIVEHDGASFASSDAPEPAAPAAAASGARNLEADLPSVTTQRHETLWMLAETHLGSGERYTQILDLNLGVAQPDGRSLGSDGRLYPGWTLRLPADARLPVERPDRHKVEPGDTLWRITGERLGDPTRFPEVFAANVGDLQPDGRRLTEPDLIMPGWVLEIPAPGDDGQPPALDGPAAAAEQPADLGEAPSPEGPASVPDEAAPGVGEPTPSALPLLDRAPLDRAPLDRAPLDRAPLDHRAERGGREPLAVSPAAPSPPALDRAPRVAGTGSVPQAQEPSEDPIPIATATPAPEPTATPASEPTVAPDAPDPTGSPRDPGPPGSADAAIVVPAGGLLAVLVLAGLAREVARRRRQFQRHRRPGERLPQPDEAARTMERLARDAVAEGESDLLDALLTELAAATQGSGRSMPRVRLVRVGAELAWLDLAEDEPDAPEPFVAVTPRCWRFDPQRVVAPAVPDERARPLPGLVTLGVSGDETVLVDLSEVGTLRIAGTASAVPGVLRALASELALGPARATTSRTLCLAEHALSEAIAAAMEAGELAVEADPTRIAAALSAAMRGGEPDPWQGDPVELVLADRALPVVVPGRSGAGLITSDPDAPAGATLELDGQGGAMLHPDDVALVPQTLAAAATAHLMGVLAATEVATPDVGAATGSDTPPPGGSEGARAALPPNAADHGEARASAAPRAPGARAMPADPVAPPVGPDLAAAPRILLLGPLEVIGAQGRAESTRYGRLSETAAFVLLNPGARPSELQSALWPGRRSNPQTCRQMISRTRTWLGRAAAGDPYLMAFTDTGGRLRLREEVGSDWAEFQQLAQAGFTDPDDTEHLAAALRLVRGRPFGAVASRELPWADLHINDMVGLITDVAHELAVRHERAGRWSAARDAALRGLSTESESEVLVDIVARVTRMQ